MTEEELRSPKALVCKKQHRADSGVGMVWFVCLADGYLLDCGAERFSEARANIIAELINAAPDRLSRSGLDAWEGCPF